MCLCSRELGGVIARRVGVFRMNQLKRCTEGGYGRPRHLGSDSRARSSPSAGNFPVFALLKTSLPSAVTIKRPPEEGTRATAATSSGSSSKISAAARTAWVRYPHSVQYSISIRDFRLITALLATKSSTSIAHRLPRSIRTWTESRTPTPKSKTTASRTLRGIPPSGACLKPETLGAS